MPTGIPAEMPASSGLHDDPRNVDSTMSCDVMVVFLEFWRKMPGRTSCWLEISSDLPWEGTSLKRVLCSDRSRSLCSILESVQSEYLQELSQLGRRFSPKGGSSPDQGSP